MPMRCVLVDDNREFLTSAAQLLESQGIEVVGVTSTGADARRLVATHRPDIVLVDVELDAEDGIELAGDLVSNAPFTRVILTSSYKRDDLSDLLATSPAAGFVPKPLLSASALGALLGR